MTDVFEELSTFEDDGIQSFSFENEGDTVEGQITKVADGWTPPKENQWGNMMRYLPLTVQTSEGDEWRLWPSAQFCPGSGNTAPKEFTRTLMDAVKASGGSLQVGGTLKVRYDGKESRTSKSGTSFSVGTYTMRYTPPAAPPVDLDEF